MEIASIFESPTSMNPAAHPASKIPQLPNPLIGRAFAMIAMVEPKTAFMQFGDTIRIEMKGKDGMSLFGAIEQTVVEAV